MLLLIFPLQSHIWQNSKSRVMCQNALAKQIVGFFKIYLKKEVIDEVYFWHADKHQSLLQADTIILGVCIPASPKYPK